MENEEKLKEWFRGVCVDNSTELVTPFLKANELFKAIDEAFEEMAKDYNKEHCVLYINDIKTIMVSEEEVKEK